MKAHGAGISKGNNWSGWILDWLNSL